MDAAAAALSTVDTVVVTAGDFATQPALEQDLERTRHLLTVNFTNTVLFCEQARTRLLGRGGTLCVFSSVAGDRGRKPVILYGAAKAGLAHYLEGLDYKYRAQGLRVVCVKPGFVKTSMTTGLKPPPFAGEADGVAADVVRAIDRGQSGRLHASDLASGDDGDSRAPEIRDATESNSERSGEITKPRRRPLAFVRFRGFNMNNMPLHRT